MYTGEVAQHLDEHGQRHHALTAAARHHVPPERCAAVGDSRSDLPLFEVVGLSIAFNGSAELRAAASVAVDGHDLRAVLPALGVVAGRRAQRSGHRALRTRTSRPRRSEEAWRAADPLLASARVVALITITRVQTACSAGAATLTAGVLLASAHALEGLVLLGLVRRPAHRPPAGRVPGVGTGCARLRFSPGAVPLPDRPRVCSASREIRPGRASRCRTGPAARAGPAAGTACGR